MSKVVQSKSIAEYESSSSRGKFYVVQANHTDDGHAYLSCNCPAWTTSSANRGKQSWERTCKHTDLATVRHVAKINLFDDLLSGQVLWWLNGTCASPRRGGAPKLVEQAAAPVNKAKAKPAPKDRIVESRFNALEL